MGTGIVYRKKVIKHIVPKMSYSTIIDHISDASFTLLKILDGKQIFLDLFVHLKTGERDRLSGLHCQG
jgi:hypothetical protein